MDDSFGAQKVKLPIIGGEMGSFNNPMNKPLNGFAAGLVQDEIGPYQTGMPSGMRPMDEMGTFDKQTAKQKTGKNLM